MALINLYLTAGGDAEHVHYEGRLSDIPALRGEDWGRLVAVSKGEMLDPAHIAHDGEVITIRKLPEGVTAAIIISSVVAISAAATCGVYSYVQTKKIQDLMEEQEKNATALSTGGNVASLPYCKGASNRMATGATFPYILGRTLFSPYKLAPDHMRISGKDGCDQYYYMVMETGFAPIVVEQLRLGNNTVKSWADRMPQDGQYRFEKGTYYDDGNLIEIRQSGNFSEDEFNHKVSVTQYMEEIPHRHMDSDATEEERREIDLEWRTGLVKQLPSNSMSAEVYILFDGLRRFDSDAGAWTSQTCTLSPQWTNVDNPTESDWHDFDTPFAQLIQPTTRTETRSAVYEYYSSESVSNSGPSSPASNQERISRVSAYLRSSWSSGTPAGNYVSGDRVDMADWRLSNLSIATGTYQSRGVNYFKFTESVTYSVTVHVAGANGSNTFTRNSKSQMRFCATQNFTAAQCYGKNMSVRIRRMTAKAESNAKDIVYLLAVQSAGYDTKLSSSSNLVQALPLEETERDKCTRIGIRIKANKQTDASLDQFSLVVTACARVWVDNGAGGKSWSSTREPTRNLAAWVLEILTSPHHLASRYSDEELDMDSFGAFYEHCEANRIYADGAITTQTTKKATLDTLMGNARASLVVNSLTGLVEVAIDKGRDYPVALLTSDNIMSLSAVKQIKRRTDGIRASFISDKADWSNDSVTFMRDGGFYDPQNDILATTTLAYITDYQQAFNFCWRQMAEEISRPLTASVRVGPCGVFYGLYDRVDLRHESLSKGLGYGTVKAMSWQSGRLHAIELAGHVTWPNGVTVGGVVINCTATMGVIYAKVRRGSNGNVLELVTDIMDSDDKVPGIGDTLSFGELDDNGKWTQTVDRMLITGIESDGYGYNLTLTEYDEAVYEYGELPEYAPSYTHVPSSSRLTLDDVREYIGRDDLTEAKGQIVSGKDRTVGSPDSILDLAATAKRDGIHVSWSAAGLGLKNTVDRYTVQFSTDGEEWETVGTTQTNSYTRTFTDSEHYEADDLAGWRYRVKLTNLYGKDSEWASSTVSTAGYGTWIVQAPSIDTKVSDRTVTLSMSQPPRSDGKVVYGTLRYELRVRLSDGEEWYTPATTENPYESENNWHSADGGDKWLARDSVYVQTMPLRGQDTADIQDTSYTWQVRAVNEAGHSESVEATATALCTNLRDIVLAKQTAKEIYVPDLSAISANLGEISEGSLEGSDSNYWTLSTKRTPTKNRDYQGAFRVGGKDQYLLVTPIVGDDGHTVVDYAIELRAGQINLSSSGLDFTAGTYIYDDNDPTIRMKLSASGLEYQMKKDNSVGWVPSNIKMAGKMSLSINELDGRKLSSLIITDSEKSTSLGVSVRNVKAYHFVSDVLDEDGGDGMNLGLDPSLLVDGGYIRGNGEGVYDGEVKFRSATHTVSVHKMDGMRFGINTVDVNGVVSSQQEKLDNAAQFNRQAITAWGLTDEQIASKLFKVKGV